MTVATAGLQESLTVCTDRLAALSVDQDRHCAASTAGAQPLLTASIRS